MDLILLTRILLYLSIPGFLFCAYRILRALNTKKIRALSQVYSSTDDPLEYRVWFWTHLILAAVFIAIISLIILEQNNLDLSQDRTGFHTRLILLLQFSALIALVPFLIRLLFSKSHNKSHDDTTQLLKQARNCATLTEAIALLEKDYRIESRDTSGDTSTITLCGIHNSSELLWIEARGEQIIEIR